MVSTRQSSSGSCWSSGVAVVRSRAKGVTLYHRDLTFLRASCDLHRHSRSSIVFQGHLEVPFPFCFAVIILMETPCTCMSRSKQLSTTFLKSKNNVHASRSAAVTVNLLPSNQTAVRIWATKYTAGFRYFVHFISLTLHLYLVHQTSAMCTLCLRNLVSLGLK